MRTAQARSPPLPSPPCAHRVPGCPTRQSSSAPGELQIEGLSPLETRGSSREEGQEPVATGVVSLCVAAEETRRAGEGRGLEAPSSAITDVPCSRCGKTQSITSHTSPAAVGSRPPPPRHFLLSSVTCRLFSSQHSGALTADFTRRKTQLLRGGP